MDLQKLNVKFFATTSRQIRLEDFIPIFNSWIQNSDGEYYDLAEYTHMQAGPGVILVAHEANISIDETGGRRGLLYNQKQALEGSNREKLRRIFKLALETCRRVENEPALDGQVKFSGSEAVVIVNDRLFAPNTAETFEGAKPDIEAVARELYGEAGFTLEHQAADPRQRFAVVLRAQEEFSVASLLRNFGVAHGANGNNRHELRSN